MVKTTPITTSMVSTFPQEPELDISEHIEDLGPLPPLGRPTNLFLDKKAKQRHRPPSLPPVNPPANQSTIHPSPSLAEAIANASNRSHVIEEDGDHRPHHEKNGTLPPIILKSKQNSGDRPDKPSESSQGDGHQLESGIHHSSNDDSPSGQASYSGSSTPKRIVSRVGLLARQMTEFAFDGVVPSRTLDVEPIESVESVAETIEKPLVEEGDLSYKPEFDYILLKFKDKDAESKFRSSHVKSFLPSLRRSLIGLLVLLVFGFILGVQHSVNSGLLAASVTIAIFPVIIVYMQSKAKHFPNYFDYYALFSGCALLAIVNLCSVVIFDTLFHPIAATIISITLFTLPTFLYARFLPMVLLAFFQILVFIIVGLTHGNLELDDEKYINEGTWVKLCIFFALASAFLSVCSARHVESIERKKFVMSELLFLHRKKMQTLVGHEVYDKLGTLESPMDYAMRNIRDIAQQSKDKVVASRLRSILVLLSEYDLHAPVALKSNPVESELDSSTKAWLRTEFRNSFITDDLYNRMTQKRDRSMSLCIYNQSAIYKTDDLQAFLSSASPDLVSSLKRALDGWNGNIFTITELSAKKPLVFVATSIFERFQLTKRLNIPVTKFLSFLREIETGYLDNPYHTSCHAADVMINTMHLLATEKIGTLLTDLDVLSVFLAAIIHDFGHNGLNNHFHMQTESKYSLMYNDKSIMENYHLYKAFTILKEERFNFLCNIPKEERKIVRDTVIDLVLCTDMAYHFDYLGKFKAKVGAGGDVDISVRENKLLVLQMALKCADLAHMAKSFPIHSRWTTLVTEEFYLQGDQEGSLKLPKSPFMDRDSENVPKSQIG
eukprot:TRINITY_DN4675_c0_g1_i3.p1 TRINITY_DN4675_c0_g1~~TRINITY_DN4675_c0_g1_i3.p1  ORF type:complete len:835 (+),score=128.47 TRINITY_DN4675_c0_g1_i3:148-2652(+)